MRYGRYQDTTIFDLPLGVYDRTSSFSNICVVPFPCLFVDRFSYRADYFERVKLITRDGLESMSHECTDRGRSSIKLIYLIFVHDLPESSGIGPGGNSFKHKRGGSRQKWTIYDIRMTCDPTDISCAPVNIFRFILEYI